MSGPSLRRTVARMPFFSRAKRKASILSGEGGIKPVSLTGLTGMRLTWIGNFSPRDGLPRRAELSTPARCAASAGDEFCPSMRVYSNEMRLPVARHHSRQAASSSATFHLLFIGIILSRTSSSAAWREIESVMGRSSRISLRMPSTCPQVESEMWRYPMHIPRSSLTSRRKR